MTSGRLQETRSGEMPWLFVDLATVSKSSPALDLPWQAEAITILANGSMEKFDTYLATIVWDGQPKIVVVQAMENVPLLERFTNGWHTRLQRSCSHSETAPRSREEPMANRGADGQQ